jgi:hypothetical protein
MRIFMTDFLNLKYIKGISREYRIIKMGDGGDKTKHRTFD